MNRKIVVFGIIIICLCQFLPMVSAAETEYDANDDFIWSFDDYSITQEDNFLIEWQWVRTDIVFIGFTFRTLDNISVYEYGYTGDEFLSRDSPTSFTFNFTNYTEYRTLQTFGLVVEITYDNWAFHKQIVRITWSPKIENTTEFPIPIYIYFIIGGLGGVSFIFYSIGRNRSCDNEKNRNKPQCKQYWDGYNDIVGVKSQVNVMPIQSRLNNKNENIKINNNDNQDLIDDMLFEDE